jgi:hypothetical protein
MDEDDRLAHARWGVTPAAGGHHAMTPDDVRKVLDSAADLAELERWDDLYELLHPVDEAGIVAGEDAGEAAYLLGLSCRGTGSWDAAASYFEAAAAQGSAVVKDDALGMLEAIRRMDTATDATADGVTQPEAASVLAAGNGALERGDYPIAVNYFRQVYDGPVDDEPRFQAALGIARVHAYRHELDDAEDYANHVKSEGPEGLSSQAAELLVWISGQRTAAQATDDGVAADEFTQAADAAMALYETRNYAEALTLFLRVYGSEHVPATSRALHALNAAVCHLSLDDDASARPLLEYAIAHGLEDTKANARSLIEHLDTLTEAQRLVEAFGAAK